MMRATLLWVALPGGGIFPSNSEKSSLNLCIIKTSNFLSLNLTLMFYAFIRLVISSSGA